MSQTKIHQDLDLDVNITMTQIQFINIAGLHGRILPVVGSGVVGSGVVGSGAVSKICLELYLIHLRPGKAFSPVTKTTKFVFLKLKSIIL